MDSISASTACSAAQEALFQAALCPALQPVAEAPAAVSGHVALPAASALATAALSAVHAGAASCWLTLTALALVATVAAVIASSAVSLAGKIEVQIP